MLGNFSVFDAIEVVNASGYTAKSSLCDHEHEVPFAKYFVNILVNDRLPFRGESLQTGNQAWNSIGDPGIVLDILDSVEIAGKGFATTVEEVVHVTLHQGLVCLGPVKLCGCGEAIDHCMPARAGLGGGLLEVVPVLDDPTPFKAKNVEANLRAEEIVFRVSKNKLAILKDTDRVDLRSLRQALRKGSNAGSALGNVKVVLNVFFGLI